MTNDPNITIEPDLNATLPTGTAATTPDAEEHSTEPVDAVTQESKAITADPDIAEEAALQIDERQLTRQALWERKLLDFSLRNTLLNTRLGRRAMQFVAFDVANLEDRLQSGVNYAITPWPEKRKKLEATDGLFHTMQQAAELRGDYDTNLSAHKLSTFLTQAEQKPVVTNLYRAARTALEENGANALFIAIGMLKWYVTDISDKPRYAPILLLPVSILRNGASYVVRLREEEPILNITLNEFLRQQFKLLLPAFEPLPRDEHGVDVEAVFKAMRSAIAIHERWEVLEESVLGIFSFNKFVMWNDIHTSSDVLQQSPIVQSLVEQRLTLEQTSADVDVREFDLTAQPSEVATPISVDSSQLEAVIESGEGKSFILYGPPGTGKSQTITNMIANALYHGRRVLFVAEKMAALSVVQRRLAKIGLAPFCLELHSNKVTKTHFLKQLNEALSVTHGHLSEDFRQRSEELFEKRQQLNGYMQAVHTPSRYGVSIYDCIERFLATDADERFELPAATTHSLDDGQMQAIVESINTLDTTFQVAGHPFAHPLSGLVLSDDRREAIQKLCEKLSELADVLPQLEEARREFNATCGVSLPATQRSMEWLIHLLDLLTYCTAEALAEDAAELRMTWEQVQAKWFIPRYFGTRTLIKRIRPYRPSITADNIDDFIEHLATHEDNSIDLNLDETAIARNFADIPGGQRAWVKRQQTLFRRWQTLLKEIEPLCTLPSPDDYATSLTQQINKWLSNKEQMRHWYQWSVQRRQLTELGLSSVVTFIEQGHTAHDAAAVLQKTVYEEWAMQLIDDNDELRQFNGIVFEEVIDRYRQLTEHFQELTKKELYCRLAANIPSITIEAATNSEVNILKRNIANGGRGTSIRHIIDQIPNLLPKLCPCMLMSPISVAQFIDPKSPKYDLVLFDEASQMPTAEAVGAIGRGKALIVVGDNKQMPPTSFFATQQIDDEDAAIDDLDSILDDCQALSMPGHFLAFHYRSKHESLIAFSNQEYYDSRLYTFPSADDRVSKVSLVHVEGTYDKGGRRSNRGEAEAVVQEIMRRLADPELSKRSIGVVAFSMAQQNLIEDVLMEALADKPELEALAFQGDEPIFLKNLENVQGDERDIILFSIGYGPDKDGNVSLNFGPLNNRGGERRLNVAVSRARYEMKVFSTLRPEQIDLRRTKSVGVAGLQKFLRYAEGRTMADINSDDVAQTTATSSSKADTTTAPRDAIAEDIARSLRDMGYETATAVGRSKFKVDVAIMDPKDPERYLLGILIDGHSRASTKIARDRELTQPSVLQGLGWKILRVWSVDWMQSSQRILSDIAAIVDGKDLDSKATVALAGTTHATPLKLEEPAILEDKPKSLKAPAKNRYTDKPRPIVSLATTQVETAALRVVEEQVALPFESLITATARVLGYQRRTPTISNNITKAIASLIVKKLLVRDGDTIKLPS